MFDLEKVFSEDSAVKRDEDGNFYGLCEYATGDSILTVSKLIAILGAFDPDTQVVIDDGDSWYNNIDTIGLPTSSDGYSAITFMQGSAPVDTRQF